MCIKIISAILLACGLVSVCRSHPRVQQGNQIQAEAKAAIQQTENSVTVNVADYGIVADSRRNATLAVLTILEEYEGDPRQLNIVFPTGRYDFWPHHAVERVYFESNTVDNNPKRCAIFMYGRKNIVIDGQGSSFVFHDRMQPFTIDSSENILLRNIKIDWDIPLTAQGEVVKTESDYIDLKINTHESPYEIIDGKLFFVGEGWKSEWGGVMEMVKETGAVAFGSNDKCLGDKWRNYQAENIAYGLVRLNYNFLRKPAVGNYLILRHSFRDHAGVFIVGSRNISLRDMEVNHAAGLGVLAQYSEDMDFRNIKFVPNKEKNRYFSGHDDGFQISNCRGSVLIDSCIFEGLMDDPINVHGTTVRVIEIMNNKTLKCRFMRETSKGMPWGRRNDLVSFIDNEIMQSIGTAEVESFRKIDRDSFEIVFSSPVPSSLEVGDALENFTWSPDVVISNSLFGGNRARGLLVSTPGKVIIEKNVFNTSGSAILIAGDANFWYESGAVKDVIIRGNEFSDGCLTSLYQFCEAIISICPEIPALKPGLPAFHRNIRIENNVFHPFDYPVLYAKSVGSLSFSDNTFTRSYRYKPFHYRKAGITLNACYDVNISGNRFNGDVLGRKIVLENMKRKEVRLSPRNVFSF